MYQGYNYYPAQMPSYLKGRPVSSIDEARVASIDFDGTMFYFPDMANKKIYTKQINADGTSSMQMFQLTELPNPSAQTDNYVTKEEFEKALKELKESFTNVEVSKQF